MLTEEVSRSSFRLGDALDDGERTQRRARKEDDVDEEQGTPVSVLALGDAHVDGEAATETAMKIGAKAAANLLRCSRSWREGRGEIGIRG